MGRRTESASSSGRSRRSRSRLHSRGAALTCAALLVLACLAPSGFAQEEAAGEACPPCEACPEWADCGPCERQVGEVQARVQGLEAQLVEKDAAIARAEVGLQELRQEVQAARAAKGAAEQDLSAQLASALAELEGSKQALAALEAQQGGEICLPPAASGAILGAWAQAKPHLETARELVGRHAAQAAEVGGELAHQSLAKGKVVATEASRLARTHLATAAAEAKRHAAPVLAQVDAAAKPYYQPAVDKLDEVTKPYQPQALEAWAAVRGAGERAVAYVHSLDLCCKYKDLAKAAAGKLSAVCRDGPGVGALVHAGNETTIVNTLVWAPTATVAYVVLFGGSGKKKKKGKGKGRRGNSKNNNRNMASPGKPAFKPSGSPFRPTPPKRH